jgi:two-component system, OmpR family, phosphate regulon sensor histidine kinase PhoR
VATIASARAKLRRAVNLGLTRPLVLLSVGVLLPIVLASGVGVVTLALSETPREIVVGVLAVVFATAAFTCGIILVVWLSKRARTARLQSDLISNVSHELKTPLAAIRIFAQTLEDAEAAADARTLHRCATGIVRETHWLEVMVERLLNWRRIPKDRAGLSVTRESLSQTVQETADRFRLMLADEGFRFEVTIEDLGIVPHDTTAVSSILMNLLTNAYKYSRKDRRMGLSLKSEDGFALMRVSDNGVGISEREQQRVLEPFYRVTGQEQTGAGGAGLGLAIVAALVAAHEGHLDIVSTPGEGTRFTVKIPLEETS